MQAVVFTIGGRTLGIDILQVHEILRMVEITPFPNMPPFALGAINLRGSVVPVIDIRLKLGLPGRPPDARTCIVLVRTGGQVLGFLADEVREVIELQESELETSGTGPEWIRSPLFSALGKLPGTLLVLINPDRLLSPQEEALLPSRAGVLPATAFTGGTA